MISTSTESVAVCFTGYVKSGLKAEELPEKIQDTIFPKWNHQKIYKEPHPIIFDFDKAGF